jgi:nucleoside-diphosphate-sugar epimerase
MSKVSVLITGAAGFIGFALAHRLLQRGGVGLDSVNDYYDPTLKNARVAVLGKFNNLSFQKIDLAARKRRRNRFSRRRIRTGRAILPRRLESVTRCKIPMPNLGYSMWVPAS